MQAEPFDDRFVAKVKDEIRRRAIDRLDTIALLSYSELVVLTPVDLGQARAGWNFSLNQTQVSVPLKLTRPEGQTGPVHPQPDPPELNASQWGDSYFISNYTAHIVPLNEGHSQQRREPKWVERALASSVKRAEATT